MQQRERVKFPGGSLLAALLGEQAPIEARRAARRLRAESAPALAIDDDIADLARGLAAAEVARAAAVLDVLPPLFWIELAQGEGLAGWVVEKKRGGIAVRGFSLAAGAAAVPALEGADTLPFGGAAEAEEAEATRHLRGLVTAIALPEMLAQMGESAPVLLLPAEASAAEASLLRGFRLSVAMAPDSAPG
ncbi:hypothetical protein [Roseomonas sp. 18066]|uniref:hypothetical protein n=1 Tax=Roseomonas sp. 18066 TaxID=2681412 RepID=UPI00135ACAC5|nr:hypothetical protein [Roseomonas sp. 18066]